MAQRGSHVMRAFAKYFEVFAAIVTAAFVLLLFVNEPRQQQAIPKPGASPGQAIYATRCAGCHGSDGAGGFGPPLAGAVTSRFPNVADQEAFVAKGSGSMPSFADSLTPEQIAAVVAYTRTELH
jgi:mono/diheme cytochrome c family protein